MDIKFQCPKCTQTLEAPADLAGTEIECPSCHAAIPVPGPVQPAAPRPAAPAPGPVAAAALPPAADTPAPRTPGFAIASLVLGIVGFLFGWACCGIMPVLAVVFGHISYSQITKNPGSFQGKGMALTGLILGYVGILLTVIILIVQFAMGFYSGYMEQMKQGHM
jgi:hypothetical protein